MRSGCGCEGRERFDRLCDGTDLDRGRTPGRRDPLDAWRDQRHALASATRRTDNRGGRRRWLRVPDLVRRVGSGRRPRKIVERLADDFAWAISNPAVHDWLVAHGMNPMSMTPETFATFVLDEKQRAQRIITPAAPHNPEAVAQMASTRSADLLRSRRAHILDTGDGRPTQSAALREAGAHSSLLRFALMVRISPSQGVCPQIGNAGQSAPVRAGSGLPPRSAGNPGRVTVQIRGQHAPLSAQSESAGGGAGRRVRSLKAGPGPSGAGGPLLCRRALVDPTRPEDKSDSAHGRQPDASAAARRPPSRRSGKPDRLGDRGANRVGDLPEALYVIRLPPDAEPPARFRPSGRRGPSAQRG